MKNSELRERSVGDLQVHESELARDLWKARFTNFTNQLDDTAKIRRLRRQVARVKTIVTQKQQAEKTPAAAAKQAVTEKAEQG
jgi:large subunit ribosomal protein L29